jgi:hypothetical protein
MSALIGQGTFCFPIQQQCARFFLVQYTKAGTSKLPNAHKIPIFNGCKIFQMTRIYNNIIHAKVLQNVPKSGVFWSEKKPFGNPVHQLLTKQTD